MVCFHVASFQSLGIAIGRAAALLHPRARARVQQRVSERSNPLPENFFGNKRTQFIMERSLWCYLPAHFVGPTVPALGDVILDRVSGDNV